MIRKVNFPLKYKFVVVITLLLLLTMGFYLSYALNIFKEDKAADVYSITLTNSISVAERTKLLINDDLFQLENLKGVAGTDLAQKMMLLTEVRDEILGVECLQGIDDYQTVVNVKKLEQYDSINASSFVLNAENGSLKQIRQLPHGAVRIDTASVAGFPAHFSVFKSIDENLKCALHISYEKLMPLMNETLNYGTYILSNTGTIFFKLNNINLGPNVQNIVRDPGIMQIQQGVKRFDENGEAIIRAFSKISGLDLIAITEIPEKKAFLASELLIQKSIYFGILLLSVAVIAGILFTKRMTKNVQTLFEATTQLSAGNFNVHPVAEGSDEIGALTDSFVDMKDKIIQYMEEMKEKARLEGEMQVAHLVQHSFFPKHAVIKDKFSFDGQYHPASECSGDWWGYFEQGPLTTIIVCDATGHGVPAALITAAAHSCISTLKIESEKNYISPKAVLSKLNKVICHMNTEILMTAFVVEIDELNKNITYSNASHMTPYLIKKKEGVYTKDGVIPLQDNNGARMGQNLDSVYEETKVDFTSGDRIIMFSDGITEMAVDGKAWGQRNFFKSIFKGCMFGPTGVIESIMTDFNSYRKELPLQDDVTLVCITFNDRVVIESLDQIPGLPELSHDEIVISKLTNAENITELLSQKNVNHLIGHNTLNLSRESRLVQILESKSVFNLQDYINSSFEKVIWSIKSNKEISQIVNAISEKFTEEFKKSINPDVLKLVSEELLSNAFYHSGGEGVHFSRGQEITLAPEKSVEYLFAYNNEYVVVSVKGPSAFSSREKVIEAIHRGYTEKTPLDGINGAGLGLYMIYENCNQFWVINGLTESGQIICVFEKFNRYKQAKERITSFHFLAKEISV